MDKNTLVESIRDFKKNIEQLLKKVDAVNGNQIQAKVMLLEVEQISTKWFEDYENLLKNSFKISENIIEQYRAGFGKLLELCDGKPSKKNIQNILKEILDNFHINITVPVQKYQSILLKFPELDKLLTNVSGIEQNYLSEAISCARYGNLRASIILGWCAAVSRLHFYIDRLGFDKFNEASVQMFAIQSGRYKRFTKKFDIHTFSELQMSVFDNDLLWILEFINAIDGNQHEKLEICFTMRNTCAHPGDAIITNENVLSFYSDLDVLVFSNPRFKI